MCFQNTRLNRHRRDVTVPKGRNRKQGRGNGFQKVKNLARQVPQDFKAGENSSLVRCAAIQTHWGGNITPKAWWGSFYPLEIVPLSLFIFPSLFIPSLCPHFGVLLCVVNFTDLFFSSIVWFVIGPIRWLFHIVFFMSGNSTELSSSLLFLLLLCSVFLHILDYVEHIYDGYLMSLFDNSIFLLISDICIYYFFLFIMGHIFLACILFLG